MKKRNAKIIKGALLVSLIALAGILVLTFVATSDRSEGWHDGFGVIRYYATEDGKIARGYQLIDGQPYYFNLVGRPCGEGWIKDSESGMDEYYCTGDGKLLTGWKYMDSKAWYFYQPEDCTGDRKAGGVARSFTTTGGIELGPDGYIDGEEGEALGYGIDVLNRYGWNLVSAFKYASSLKYADGRENDYGLKVHSCALNGFRLGQGNCLAWSGTFCTMARLLGYDCKMVWGTLHFRGEDVTHAWTEIWEEDGPHVYDPRKNGGKDLGGFNKHYGDKGTYKYNEDSIEYLEW